MINELILLRVIVYGLATFRVTMLLHNEEGPWAFFDWIRFKMGLIYRSETTSFEFRDDVFQPFIGKLLRCPTCLSGWLAPGAVVGILISNPYLDATALWLAVWGIIYFLIKAAKK